MCPAMISVQGTYQEYVVNTPCPLGVYKKYTVHSRKLQKGSFSRKVAKRAFQFSTISGRSFFEELRVCRPVFSSIYTKVL